MAVLDAALAPGGREAGTTTAPAGHPKAGHSKSGHQVHLAGLDGLRALAVTAVVVYHLGWTWLPGGFLGVDLFFVISGFLITTLLLAEVRVQGRIDLTAFYRRRARRLLPALLVALAATSVLAATVARDAASQFLRDLPAALAYVSNWWAIAQDQSYFEMVGRGNLLAHLWSLAVEEQFYLIWPLLLTGLVVVGRRSRWGVGPVVLFSSVALAFASTAWMAALSIAQDLPANDPSRVYFGTDTHAMSVLIGCALAACWRPATMRRRITGTARRIIEVLGLAALVGAFAVFATVTETSSILYRGGFLAIACLFALAVAAATHPAARVGRVLDMRPVKWIGARSYGIYLWHWPVFLVTRPGIDIPWSGPAVDVARVAFVVAIAAASYTYVEMPIRRGALVGAFSRARLTWSQDGLRVLLPATARSRILAAASLIACAAVTASLVTAPAPGKTLESLGDTTSVSDSSAPANSRSTATGEITGADVSLFGDSVALFAVKSLRASMPGIAIDAGLNRAPAYIENEVAKALDAGTLRRAVVLHIGNAGLVRTEALESLLSRLSDRERVVIVNARARFPYVPQGNANIAEVAAKYPNVSVADWAGKAANHPEWFVDALHLSEEAKPIFADFIRDAVLGTASPTRFAGMPVG